MKRRIAILFHEADRERDLSGYSINGLASHWREDGHEVVPVFGVRTFVSADLVFVHVDLSVVPQDYLDFAKCYPIAINGKVKDIRKSVFSPHLLSQEDTYPGPVILKSNRNFGGIPEAARGIPRLDGMGMDPLFRSPGEYRIYESMREVPHWAFESPDLVVQRFLPEMEDGRFHVRCYQFLGDKATCTRVGADDPIVRSETKVFSESVAPHPEIVEMRHELNFDYGKFDYVIHGGQAILLDINKTTGTARNFTPQIAAIRRTNAQGLYSYFPR